MLARHQTLASGHSTLSVPSGSDTNLFLHNDLSHTFQASKPRRTDALFKSALASAAQEKETDVLEDSWLRVQSRTLKWRDKRPPPTLCTLFYGGQAWMCAA